MSSNSALRSWVPLERLGLFSYNKGNDLHLKGPLWSLNMCSLYGKFYITSSYLYFHEPFLWATDLFSASMALVSAVAVMSMIASFTSFHCSDSSLSSQSGGLSVVTWKSGFLWFPWECEAVINWNFLLFFLQENLSIHSPPLFSAMLFFISLL